MQTIRVLIYTDRFDPCNPSGNISLGPVDFGLTIMRDLIIANERPLSKIKIDLLNRNFPTEASQKLTPQVLSGYDELWVFGYYMVKIDGKYSALNGGAQNELGDDEVEALCEWMKCGGVLISGDHSNKNPRPDCQPAKFLSLGRALGHRVPRAGRMRRWDMGPTVDESYNTQVPYKLTDLDKPMLQSDPQPQHIFLSLRKEGELSIPHDLFRAGLTDVIQVFPDHMHEGELLMAQALPDLVPAVEIVAMGADHRCFPPKLYPLVSVYDGDSVSLGRIVADSSWHHYLNVNLRGLPKSTDCACTPVAHLDLVGQYYANLVYWLAPKKLRGGMRLEMLRWIANHAQVVEVAGSDLYTLGITGHNVLDLHFKPRQVDDLLKSIVPELLKPLLKYLAPFPQHMFLGAVIREIHNNMRRLSDAESGASAEEVINSELIGRAFDNVMGTYLNEMKSQIGAVENLYKTLAGYSPAEVDHQREDESGDDRNDDGN